MDPDKVKVVQEWPEPTSVRELRAFLGFTGFFRQFIRGYATVAGPLFRYLKGVQGKKKNRTGSEHIMLDDAGCIAFRELIRCLVEAPVLAYANFGEPFRLETDASSTGLGAILFQDDDEGRHRVIAYASRALRPSERSGRYSAFKLKLLAIKMGCDGNLQGLPPWA